VALKPLELQGKFHGNALFLKSLNEIKFRGRNIILMIQNDRTTNGELLVSQMLVGFGNLLR